MKKGRRADPPLQPAAQSASGLPQEQLRDIRARLLAYFDREKRDLPWRAESDPYRIWVSEVMLQQTRVETVLPYYERWVERFPTLEALAEADDEEVLKAWEGLGYYSRARRLHGAARVVRERYAGELPGTAEELKELPGVGEYTAGALASIAFGRAVPAVDGNVRRVSSRLFDLPDPKPGEVRKLAVSLVDPVRPGDFNQALMELGATLCTPRAPSCRDCPLEELCAARARGAEEERPLPRRKKEVPEVDVAVLVAVASAEPPGAGKSRRDGVPAFSLPGTFRFASSGPPSTPRLLVRKRPAKGLLAGMWEFPGWEEEGTGDAPDRLRDGQELPAVLRQGMKELGLEPVSDPGPESRAHRSGALSLSTVTHVFSHLKARYRALLVLVAGQPLVDGCRWVFPEELDELPLPVAQQKIARAALEALGVPGPGAPEGNFGGEISEQKPLTPGGPREQGECTPPEPGDHE